MSEYKLTRTIVGHLERGTDLYEGIARVIEENGIRLGRVMGIGAVQKARLAYYDQKTMKYLAYDIPQPMEILNLHGNISMKDGKPFLHAHVVLSDDQGNGRGGHLLPGGSPVFACEITLEELEGPDLTRSLDAKTGLTLWPPDKTL